MSGYEDEYGADADVDAGLDPEGPSADDLRRFGDSFARCPNCGADQYDQAEVCSVCGAPMDMKFDTNRQLWLRSIVGAVLVGMLAYLLF